MAGNIAVARLRGYWKTINQHWNSATFRLTLNYGLLTILTTLILLLFIYIQVVDVLRTQLASQINHAQQRLVTMLHSGGVTAVIDAIDLAIADELDGGDDLYLLTNRDGRRLAGNIDATQSYAGYGGLFEMDVLLGEREIRGHFKRQALPDGHILLIGHEAGKTDQVTGMILRAIGFTVALAVVLVVLGAYVFRREFERRIGPLRATTRQIGAGQLSLRVPQTNDSDEFSRLNHEVNAMLDRIERLMEGVRHVSDTIAHDLRTPLMRMQGHLRSVQHSGASKEELANAVDRAIEEIDRLNTLLGKLLQISELEAGVRRKAFITCRLDLIVADIVDLYSALAEENQIILEMDAQQPVSVHGDPELLANACANLVDNALKHAATRVSVGVDNSNEGVYLYVKDDGPGLPGTSLERLGERFYRPGATQEGLGLGLASVKAMVSLHGGRLDFSNGSGLREARGLEARIFLPEQPVAAEPL